MADLAALDDPLVLFGNRQRILSVDVEYRDFVTVNDDRHLWNHSRKIVQNSLCRQAKKCANALLTPADVKPDGRAHQYVRSCIWESVKASPHVYMTRRRDNREFYLFALGRGLSDCVVNKDGEIAVIAETNLAFPYDDAKQAFYLPLSENFRRPFPYAWKGIPSARNSKPPFEPFWEPCLATRAADALDSAVDPGVVVWCLEHQKNEPGSLPLTNGRLYIPLAPSGHSHIETIMRKHYSTIEDFHERAVNAFLAKWSDSIDPLKIEAFLGKRVAVNKVDKQDKQVFDDKGDPVQIFLDRMNVHHRWPVYFGGDNAYRTYIDRRVHKNIIHADFNYTFDRVCEVLGIRNRWSFEREFPSKNLEECPELVERLNGIKHVRAEGGEISIGILWPQDIYFVPSLAHFEMQWGGIYGPGDEGYKRNLPRRSVPAGEARGAKAASLPNG